MSLVKEASPLTGHLNNNEVNPAKCEEEDEGEIYEVERILKDRVKRGIRQFLVRWKGYGSDEDSWEPEENLDGANEVLSRYLAIVDKRKSKSDGKTIKEKKNTTYKDDDSSSVDSSKESDTEFEPVKKRSRKSTATPNSRALKEHTKTLTETPTSNVDRVVARRRNLSKNMRWIDESSDDSEESNGEHAASNAVPTPSSVHPDSSTDVGKKSFSKKPARNSTGNGAENKSLKLKFTKSDALAEFHNASTLKVSMIEGEKHKTTKSKKNKSHKKKGSSTHHDVSIDVLQEASNSKATLTFTGVYREKGELWYVAVDNKTAKRCVYQLGDAFMADGWSICRFLSSRVKFSSDGDSFVNGDSHSDN